MPSLFALLHFNTQSHTKLPTKDLMQSLLYFRVTATADEKSLTRTTGLHGKATIFCTNILEISQEIGNYSGSYFIVVISVIEEAKGIKIFLTLVAIYNRVALTFVLKNTSAVILHR